MYLSKLELHGFKSFAERTALQFDDGVTSIVGPNGCGKSNIVDAVRWVIGEQRARILRSEKMENVIFNGTTKRRPLGMAEVQLTIENTRGVLPTEYSEVTLGRRLYRSGESEYLLNGVKCRLQDITDLFMDTGMGAGAYSVIELKMVDEILSENAQDRRRLFEEAAGITKYKLRRRQALSKLEGTQADLTRLVDLTEEIEKRVRSLKRQAERAARFKTHQERLHHLELVLAQIEYDRLSDQKRTLEAEIQALQGQAERLSADLEGSEARLEALRGELDRREEELAGRRRELNKHLERVRSLESDLRLEEERLEVGRRERDRLVREEQEDEARRAALVRTQARLEEELAAAGPVLEEAEAALGEAEAERDRARSAAVAQRERLQGLRRQEQRAEDERTDRRRGLDRFMSRRELLEGEEERLLAETAGLEEAAEDLDARVAHARRVREEARERLRTREAALERAQEEREERQQALQAATDALRDVERRRDAAAAEAGLLESLVSSYEEFSDAVQFLAAAPEGAPAELRTVADVLACPEEDRLALDAALGDLASCIVVSSEREAERAIALLRREGKGQATFLVLDRLRLPERLPQPDPAARPLLGRVDTSDARYRPLAELLLHDAYLVDSLEEARRAADHGTRAARYFTPEGDWREARGLVHGGSQGRAVPTADRLGRREQLEAVRQHLAELDDAYERERAAAAALREDLEAVPFERRRTERAEAEQALREAESVYDRLTYEAEALDRRCTAQGERLDHLRGEIAGGGDERERLEVAARAAEEALLDVRRERTAAEEAFQAAELESRAALGRYSDLHVSAVQARNRLDNLRHDRERAERSLLHLEERAEARSAERQRLQEEIAAAQERRSSLTAELQEIHRHRAGLEEDVAEAERALGQTKTAITEVEAHLRAVRTQREQEMREENQRAVRLAEVQTRTADLLENIREDFGIALEVHRVEVEAGFDETRARAEVQELRTQIRKLGAVNELALESYEEEKERLDFLQSQQQDLEQAEETLLSTISEINATAAARFDETYSAIRESFTRIFEELFGEDATADLQLEDPDDPLESAIEIVAKPRGKRPSTIAQLSGGEKTLTAIALLFAIYLVKPSPFCILDEVDAPLDDANVERFMRLIREFSDNTQFILVTHNKRTMELADRMYGITMQEQGVSRVVGVQFDEAVELAGS